MSVTLTNASEILLVGRMTRNSIWKTQNIDAQSHMSSDYEVSMKYT